MAIEGEQGAQKAPVAGDWGLSAGRAARRSASRAVDDEAGNGYAERIGDLPQEADGRHALGRFDLSEHGPADPGELRQAFERVALRLAQPLQILSHDGGNIANGRLKRTLGAQSGDASPPPPSLLLDISMLPAAIIDLLSYINGGAANGGTKKKC